MDPRRGPSSSTDSAGRRNKRPMYEEDSSEELGDDDDTGEIKAAKNWSSARKVNLIVSKFGELKSNLVRNIGFGGILDLPLFNKVDRKFTLWLLSRIDCLRRVIVVNGEDQTDIVDMDVQRILGIPCGTMAVCGLNSDELSMEFEFRNLKTAELVVKKDYPNGMDKIEMDKFKVAFVVFVMGTFLAPTCKFNAVNPDFLGSLVNPDEINQYNWSAYVLDHLIQAATRVQDDLRTRGDVSNITGCSLLIQIIYLESLRIPPLMRPGKANPRVKAYDCETMRKMILADKASSSGYTDNPSWGCIQTRHRKLSTSQAARIATSSTIGQNIQDDNSAPHYPPDPETNDLIQSMNNFPKKLSDVLDQHSGSNQLSPQQVSALSWYHARTTRLVNQLKETLFNDQILLIEKLAAGAAQKSQVIAPEEPMNLNRTNSLLQDGYASGTESATEGIDHDLLSCYTHIRRIGVISFHMRVIKPNEGLY